MAEKEPPIPRQKTHAEKGPFFMAILGPEDKVVASTDDPDIKALQQGIIDVAHAVGADGVQRLTDAMKHGRLDKELVTFEPSDPPKKPKRK